jgi:hypothetical protein
MQQTIKSGQVIVVSPNGDGLSLTVTIYEKEYVDKKQFSFDMNIPNAAVFISLIKEAIARIPESIR